MSENERPPTDRELAARALSRCGHAPVLLDSMSTDRIATIARLIDSTGNLASGARERLRLVLVDHYEEQKATAEDLDE